jgi:signal transduction histidine kinase
MRRLHLKFFLALMVTVIVFLACWEMIDRRLEARDPDFAWTVERFRRIAPQLLPTADAPKAELEQELERIGQNTGADLSVYGPEGSLLGAAGEALPRPVDGATGWFAGPETRPVVALPLDDNRTLVAAPSSPIPSENPEFIALTVFVPMILLATYFLARRMTRRIGQLKLGVDRLGSGNLEARVPVEGADEISDLSRGFNRAADRIQELVGAQRSMLALVSHELRSPLARLRMAIELLQERPDPDLQRQARQDIAELDELIEQLLLASRLQAAGAPGRSDPVDLLALSAEEGARVGADVSGRPVKVKGDAVYLRRLLRNLFENARRHGRGGPIEAKVDFSAEGSAVACITVSDRGPGVPEAERERIFEPFYRISGGTEKAKGGIGLGLALVRQIARHHGGDVHCIPREGGGTTFEVHLPTESPRH